MTDTGCGIPKKDLKSIFEPYITLREDGTGLGLTICKRIVEDHEGKITIVSKEDIGTTVRVELPAIEV